MLKSVHGNRGAVTAPHHLASQAGLEILRQGGTAIEAMVAMAASIAVVYPHMNGLGGDGFWLIHLPGDQAGKDPVAISACGPAAAKATPELYAKAGHKTIPPRGALGANTVAGTVSGWQAALQVSQELGQALPLGALLEHARHYAVAGVAVSEGQARLTRAKYDEARDAPGFTGHFAPEGVPRPGELFRQLRLAETLGALEEGGLDGFYRGKLAKRIAADLERAGSPVSIADLEGYHAGQVTPLSVDLDDARLFNHPPPTQGLASLIILKLFDMLGRPGPQDTFAHIHGLVEATKQAFLLRDKHIADPGAMSVDPATLLEEKTLKELVGNIDMDKALAWPHPAQKGDTIWMGAVDETGCAVSFIQSLYWEFGSGVVLEDTGLVWQNRGASFSLDPAARNALAPGKLPFHTLNPALVRFNDGRVMAYGTMGGEGQPQTQAALYTRHAMFGEDLQRAITAPRWLLGRTWGEETTSLKLEARVDDALISQLRAAGHDVEIVDDFDDIVGHAGAVLRHEDGRMEAASDPRSDGQAMAY